MKRVCFFDCFAGFGFYVERGAVCVCVCACGAREPKPQKDAGRCGGRGQRRKKNDAATSTLCENTGVLRPRPLRLARPPKTRRHAVHTTAHNTTRTPATRPPRPGRRGRPGGQRPARPGPHAHRRPRVPGPPVRGRASASDRVCCRGGSAVVSAEGGVERGECVGGDSANGKANRVLGGTGARGRLLRPRHAGHVGLRMGPCRVGGGGCTGGRRHPTPPQRPSALTHTHGASFPQPHAHSSSSSSPPRPPPTPPPAASWPPTRAPATRAVALGRPGARCATARARWRTKENTYMMATPAPAASAPATSPASSVGACLRGACLRTRGSRGWGRARRGSPHQPRWARGAGGLGMGPNKRCWTSVGDVGLWLHPPRVSVREREREFTHIFDGWITQRHLEREGTERFCFLFPFVRPSPPRSLFFYSRSHGSRITRTHTHTHDRARGSAFFVLAVFALRIFNQPTLFFRTAFSPPPPPPPPSCPERVELCVAVFAFFCNTTFFPR